mgnify:CR=1 FL=1
MMIYETALLGHAPRAMVPVVIAYPKGSHAKVCKGSFRMEIIQTVFSAPEVYAIVLKETGEPVGSCGIMFADGVHSAAIGESEAEIGYWIGRPGIGGSPPPQQHARCFHHLLSSEEVMDLFA